jgi:hypothetical protein
MPKVLGVIPGTEEKQNRKPKRLPYPHFFFFFSHGAGIKPRILDMLSKHFIPELYPPTLGSLRQGLAFLIIIIIHMCIQYETGSCFEDQAGLEFTVLCFNLLSAEITDVYNHTQQGEKFYSTMCASHGVLSQGQNNKPTSLRLESSKL